jgi:group I intron endonuclease
MFDVYCHTSPSGKRYVGQSRGGMSARWREHVQEAASGADRLLCRAIRKYGADAFRHEVLEQCDTQAGAYAAERRWISQRGTLAPAGYNMTTGGDGCPGGCAEVSAKRRAAWTPERRQRFGALTSARNRASAGKTRSPEFCAKVSAALRGNKYCVGRVYTAEEREKRSAATRGKARGPISDAHRAALTVARRARAAPTDATREKTRASWTPEKRLIRSLEYRARHIAQKAGYL